ncbi:MAG: NADH-quinone oxidoreductase subunit K [Bacteroidales bacterium]|nr:MAG: NADH-quinone oxidoreductase subunit K [Bacteroidales bacterium]
MIVYLLCFILFLVGLFGVLTKRNVIKIVIGLSIMEFSIFLFFALIGYIDEGLAPIIVQNISSTKFVDPLPQAMVLTAIVIGLATNSMLLAIAIRLYKKYNTFDIRKINSLKG